MAAVGTLSITNFTLSLGDINGKKKIVFSLKFWLITLIFSARFAKIHSFESMKLIFWKKVFLFGKQGYIFRVFSMGIDEKPDEKAPLLWSPAKP